MIYKKLRIIRSFCSCSSWWNKDGFSIPGAKAALVLLSALSLPSLAQSPGQITVTALPYVLSNTGGVIINTNFPVKPVPQAVGISTFGSLFGGGFGAIKAAYPATHGGVSAIVAVNKLRIVQDEAADQRALAQMQAKDIEEISEQQAKTQCSISKVVQPNGIASRRLPNATRARRMRNGFPRIAAADTCELPEEESAEEAEEEVEALNESESASQDALEAAEAAEVTAEAAEAAVEGALEAVEILETILEACSLF